ncbi:MAG: alkaline shock response membrane anchor protein AmaP [Candidatus Omnitrophica bacterium]|nr:alkaline shock response membrane anchor protein AmaP [Candidatus Omnitrophota bacterium]MCA9425996.1 alkaline shock response membrane anchor protein AmaP [Candidatus Omnitrophota bacterium]
MGEAMDFSFRNLARGAVYVCILWVGLEGVCFIASGLGWQRGLESLLPFSPFMEIGWGLRIVSWIMGILLIALSVLALIQPWIATHDDSINLQNEKGKVWLSSRTISEYIQKKSSEIEEVDNLRVKVKPSGEKVSLNVEVSVRGDSPLPAVTDRIQKFIEKELKETIGVEKVDGIHIYFKKIGGAPEALPSPALKESPKAIGGKEDAVETETVEAEIEN